MDDFIKINNSLLPFSWLYGLGVEIRNFLFNIGILKSRSFDIPVISVGNITVGGTGKTPHVEYLIRLLQDKFNIAVLSRGYKRKSKGFVLADEDTQMRTIGDEPYQMKQKFPNIAVAVDKNRCNGIEQICNNKKTKYTDVILLDDAYRSEEHTSELQSADHIVCRIMLEKKKKRAQPTPTNKPITTPSNHTSPTHPH